MRILAIDPGTHESGWVVYDIDGGTVLNGAVTDNDALLCGLVDQEPFETVDMHLAIEMIASYGMPVGREVFETCVWIGRFIQAAQIEHTFIYRRDVKRHVCNNAHAKDSNIRQALIDRFGGSKEAAIGLKKTPGPLYGFKSHMWAALAVAVTHGDALNDASLPW